MTRARGRVSGCGLEIEQRSDDGKGELIIRSVPFGTTTDSVIASIETAARKKNLSIKSIHDFTAESVEVEILLAAGQDPARAIRALYAFTQCEVALASRIVVIQDNRPVELSADEVLRHNTRTLVKTLRRELEAERRRLLAELHNKTLVRIFIENRIYKRIEEQKTYADVQRAVLDGVNPYRSLLRRDVTTKDVEMLLAIKIKRISRHDIDRNRKEIDAILGGLEEVEGSLQKLVAHAVRFLRGLIRKYGDAYPRSTEILTFDAVVVRDLIAQELTLCYDSAKGYLGHAVEGEERLQCSSLDRVLIVSGDGPYKVTMPPADDSFLIMATEIAFAHHEKWDGSGYPFGLAADGISLAARIVAVADVYDALTSERCYKKAMSHEKATEIIVEGSGGHFDPAIVEAYLAVQDDIRAAAAKLRENLRHERS